MIKKVLYSDIYRPLKPAQLIGESQQKFAIKLLDSIKAGTPHNKILFLGSSGIGKTTISEMFVRHLLNLDPGDEIDNYVKVVNCSDETGIDNIRAIIQTFRAHSLIATYRILFLDELHGLTKQAQNALLTPLEKLPGHVIVIAATTEKQKVIATLQRRFFKCELLPPTRKEFMIMAGWISKAHETTVTDKDVNEIIDRSGNNVGEFVNYLQQLITGSYSSAQENVVLDSAFEILLLKNEKRPNVVFKTLENEPDFGAMIIRLGRGCITSIKGGKTGQYRQNCELFLEIFGDGLSTTTDSSISFHKKLLEFLARK